MGAQNGKMSGARAQGTGPWGLVKEDEISVEDYLKSGSNSRRVSLDMSARSPRSSLDGGHEVRRKSLDGKQRPRALSTYGLDYGSLQSSPVGSPTSNGVSFITNSPLGSPTDEIRSIGILD